MVSATTNEMPKAFLHSPVFMITDLVDGMDGYWSCSCFRRYRVSKPECPFHPKPHFLTDTSNWLRWLLRHNLRKHEYVKWIT